MSEPNAAWQKLSAGNQRFFVPLVSGRTEPAESRPAAAVLQCADDGVCAEMVFGQAWGALVNARSWGHVIDTGIIATMEYAVGTRQAPLIVVLGHRECAAVATALRAWDEAVMPEGALRAVVEQVSSSIIRRGAGTAEPTHAAIAHVIETGVALLQRSPLIAQRVDAGQCAIVCAVPSSDGHVEAIATIGDVDAPEDRLLECV
ncbi:carbonic anhydrase [Mycobacterium sp. IDR2000157661]|uniref:carbonic anhydrase n=1 Tax=Mycobacterium sp. IDR2000157661 TaxID=2867005 RepID=UPI001EEB2D98|nr:carbonic anhydrase [Mycobacterium sp. IDR2000157661]ULE32064.1 carbonic anhydrase [Mycobacterium sp. IDR2000157661]